MGKIIRNGINYGGTYEDATSVNYDNSNSGLDAHTIQEAIDEVQDDLSSLISKFKFSNSIYRIGFEKSSVNSDFVISIYMDETGTSRYQVIFNGNGIIARYTTDGGSTWTTIFNK